MIDEVKKELEECKKELEVMKTRGNMIVQKLNEFQQARDKLGAEMVACQGAINRLEKIIKSRKVEEKIPSNKNKK